MKCCWQAQPPPRLGQLWHDALRRHARHAGRHAGWHAAAHGHVRPAHDGRPGRDGRRPGGRGGAAAGRGAILVMERWAREGVTVSATFALARTVRTFVLAI